MMFSRSRIVLQSILAGVNGDLCRRVFEAHLDRSAPIPSVPMREEDERSLFERTLPHVSEQFAKAAQQLQEMEQRLEFYQLALAEEEQDYREERDLWIRQRPHLPSLRKGVLQLGAIMVVVLVLEYGIALPAGFDFVGADIADPLGASLLTFVTALLLSAACLVATVFLAWVVVRRGEEG